METVDMLEKFNEITGIQFHNPDFLLQALTHRSYVNEHPEVPFGNNERLEFLGDAVVELVVTEFLYTEFPNKTEGEMTNYRAALVNTVMFAEVSRELGLNDLVQLSKGEARDNGRARESILADVFEAVLGALYLDQGYDAVKKFLHAVLIPHMKEVIDRKLWRDPKSAFQEAAQEHKSITPSYRVLSAVGPDHDKEFFIGAFLGKEQVGSGEGKSKQEAEVAAARDALEKKGW